uniref:Uncharacterized protein n=1 Tax=Oryza sativa subsp. japonica TaxID=39947 RepID=Q5VMY5_ORYSJ|nr:hypothetical protein [Oryza sativa Japonica Group]BAD69190.1 hypothetical protein [Oryza sativa Japonica Group]
MVPRWHVDSVRGDGTALLNDVAERRVRQGGDFSPLTAYALVPLGCLRHVHGDGFLGFRALGNAGQDNLEFMQSKLKILHH